MANVKLFLSCVSDEFGAYRRILRHRLTHRRVEIKIQEDFSSTGGDTLAMLEDYIESCDAVVHFIGDMTGSSPEPSSVDDLLRRRFDLADRLAKKGMGRGALKSLTYTQWEAWLAVGFNRDGARRNLVIVTPADRAKRGWKFAPTDASRASQAEHLGRLKAINFYPGPPFTSADNLAVQVLKSAVLDVLNQRGERLWEVSRIYPDDTNSVGEGDQSEMILPMDAEAVAQRYWSDPVRDATRIRVMERVSTELDRRGWRVVATERGQGCTCPAFNERLISDVPVIKLRLLQEPWLAYDVYSANLRIYVLLEAHKERKTFFNSLKIRIASDFFKDGQTEVAIQKTDYLSSAMTDQLAWICIRSKKLSAARGAAQQVLWDGLAAFIDNEPGTQKARLKDLGETTVSNQLGGSTIAFSSDGHLMIVAQNDKNRQSVNLLAPSGSGSLDWSDVERSGASDLLGLVRFGSERELREEASLDEDGTGRRRIPSKVMVTAFTRSVSE